MEKYELLFSNYEVSSPYCGTVNNTSHHTLIVPSLIPLSGVDTTCSHHVVIKIR
jgi:hypothetical protein